MTDLDALSRKPAAAIGQALAAGEADPIALAELYLDRIAQQTSPVFLSVTRDRALREARESAERLKEGRPASVLDGVPIAWKDLFDIEGEITTGGSDYYRNAEPAHADASTVANACAAGMVTLGKLNLTEFAYSGLGLNPHFGTPRNPHDDQTARIPGGSSSGSGVAVPAGLAPCTIGTDTGGSVRIPASFNGLVGYKSSEGRIDRTGVFLLSRTHDTAGPLARTVEDCIVLDRALRGDPVSSVQPSELSGQRLIIPDAVVLDDLDEAVARNFERAVRDLERAGMRVETGLSDVMAQAAGLIADHGTIVGAEAYERHRSLVDSPDCARIDSRVVDRIMIGRGMSEADVTALRDGRAWLIKTVAALEDGVIAMPTTAMTAPEIAPLQADNDFFHRTNLKALRNTSLGNFLDMPGLAMPSGTDSKGLPTSILISVPSGQDERLFRAGLAIEAVLNEAQDS
jgi:aspartyl-tRNA(Asn)/glutamyl-tRNA(Gln) amidotransferase subunit A